MTSPKQYAAKTRPGVVRVADALPDAELIAGRSVSASSCCSSASLVQPGDLFFAVNAAETDGPKPDGHAAAELAIARGAVAVVLEQPVKLPGATQYQVSNTRAALARFCHSVVGKPSHTKPVIGVVGNSAPASITRLLGPALASTGSLPAWWDGRWMSDGGPPTDVGTTASAPLVASWLSRSVANDCGHAVASLSRQSLADESFTATAFQAICLAEGPLPAEPGEPVAKHLTQLTTQLRAGGVLIANAADPICCRAIAESSHRVLTYGLNQAADVTGEVLEQHTGGQTLMIRYGLESVAIETAVLGDTHAESCLAACAIGVACGIDLPAIANGVQSAPRPPGVLEPVVLGQDFAVFLDASATVNPLRNATGAVQRATTGRVLTVVANSSGKADPRLLSAAARKSDLVITHGQPAPGLSGRPEFRFVEEPFAAMALGVALAEQGDSLLISGIELDSEGHSPTGDIIRELIALRNANSPPAWAA